MMKLPFIGSRPQQAPEPGREDLAAALSRASQARRSAANSLSAHAEDCAQLVAQAPTAEPPVVRGEYRGPDRRGRLAAK